MALKNQVNINAILAKLMQEVDKLDSTSIVALNDATSYPNATIEDRLAATQISLSTLANAVHEFTSYWHKYCSMWNEAVDNENNKIDKILDIVQNGANCANANVDNENNSKIDKILDIVQNGVNVTIEDDSGESKQVGIADVCMMLGELGEVFNSYIETQNQNWSILGQQMMAMQQLNSRVDGAIGQIALKEYMQTEEYKNSRIGNKSAFKNVDENLIRRMYEAGESTKQIAHTFGVSVPTINSRLKKLGIWVDRRAKARG